jgi:hypothetical protein
VGPKKSKRKTDRPERSASRNPASVDRRGVPSSRREQRFTSIVPVRFEPAVLDEVRDRAASDGRSVSAWIRRAVEAQLLREAGAEPAT